MSQPNGHDEVRVLLGGLTAAELARLDTALATIAAGPGSKIDLTAAIEAIRQPIAPPVPGTQAWRIETDGGRGYELLLLGLTDEEAKQRYETEWARVEAMVASGMSYERAWARIRSEDWCIGLGHNSSPADEGQYGARFRARPVARPSPRLRRGRRTAAED